MLGNLALHASLSQSCLVHILAALPFLHDLGHSYFTSLSLAFFFCKVGILIPT